MGFRGGLEFSMQHGFRLARYSSMEMAYVWVCNTNPVLYHDDLASCLELDTLSFTYDGSVSSGPAKGARSSVQSTNAMA